jgi:hypothetical protein
MACRPASHAGFAYFLLQLQLVAGCFAGAASVILVRPVPRPSLGGLARNDEIGDELVNLHHQQRQLQHQHTKHLSIFAS